MLLRKKIDKPFCNVYILSIILKTNRNIIYFGVLLFFVMPK